MSWFLKNKIKPFSKELIIIYALVAAGIVGLILIVRNYPLSNFDLNITREIQKQRVWDLTFFMEIISIFGDPVIAPLSIIFTSLFFFFTHRRREAYFTFAVILADLANILVKFLIHRPRPTLDDARILLKVSQTGFPSGHVVHYVVFFGFFLAIMVAGKKIALFWRYFVGSLSAFLILTVSFSRIYLGAHWATDVIGGYLFGFIYLGVILKYYFKAPWFKLSTTSLA
jgi:undecaprenyl-diphosphatase